MGRLVTPATELKATAVRGASVTVASQCVKFVLRVGSTAVLARILSPEDYGLIAMASVTVGFAGLFRDGGLTWATVQGKSINHEQVSALFWVNVALGCLTATALATFAPAVSGLFQEPRLTAIIRVLGLSFVLGGMTVQHQALLRRQLRFTSLAAIELVSMVVGILTGLCMAHAGFGYWALVGMTLSTAAANLTAVWIMLPWRPGLPRRGAGVAPLLRFGSDVLSFNIVNYFSRQADNLLIGLYWGAVPLGLYEKAYNLLLLPINQINAPLAAVAVPALSRTTGDPEKFRRYFLSCYQMVASFGVPVVLGIALFADQIVGLWLGPQWQESARLFRVLAAAALFSALTNPMGWMLVSAGLTRRYRQMGLVTAPVFVGAFAIGLPYGAEGVAIAYSSVSALQMVPVWKWATRGTAITVGDIARQLSAPLSAGAGASFLAWVGLRTSGIESDGANAAVAGVIFAVTYAVVLLHLFRKWHFFTGIVQTLRAPTRAAQAPPA